MVLKQKFSYVSRFQNLLAFPVPDQARQNVHSELASYFNCHRWCGVNTNDQNPCPLRGHIHAKRGWKWTVTEGQSAVHLILACWATCFQQRIQTELPLS